MLGCEARNNLAAPPLVGTAIIFHTTSILDAHGIGYVEAGA